jgi:hypothetical protein
MRLATCKSLERPGVSDAERSAYGAKVAIAAGQAAGQLDDSITPTHVLALVLGS